MFCTTTWHRLLSPSTRLITTEQGAALNTQLVRWTVSAVAAVILLLSGDAVALAQEVGPEPVPLEVVPEPVEPAGDGATAGEEADAAEEVVGGIPTHPVEILQMMRAWLVPFVLASVIAVWFAIERIVVLRHGRVIPRNFVDPFLEQLRTGRLDAATALAQCEKNDSAIAAVFAHGVRKWGRPGVEVEQAIIDGGERQIGQLRRHLRVINGVATVTPLLGLLGTVIGMIESFNVIATAGAMGKADQLASGIAVALLTTAAGLAIAIPALITYMYLSGRVEALVMEMDELAQGVVRSVSAEALQARQARSARQRHAGVTPPAPSAETPEPVA